MASHRAAIPDELASLVDDAWLRDGSIESVLQSIALPRELLYQFASVCIRSTLSRTHSLGIVLHKASREGLAALCMWADGDLSQEKWQRKAKGAWHAMEELDAEQHQRAERSFSPLSLSEQRRWTVAYQLSRAIAWSGTLQASEAADMAAWCSAEAIAAMAPIEQQAMRWAIERTTQRQRLADMTLSFLREQRLELLEIMLLRSARSRDAVSQWQTTLHDALF